MRSFKNFFNEKVEPAYGIRPKAGDEQDFMDKHVVDVIDHPLNDKETLNGTKKSPGKKKRKADYDQESGEDVYESKDEDEDEDEDDDDLDPVNKKAVKKKFKDREDKDIDNDGDEDESDEYLHKRRKAVSKAIEKVKEEIELDEETIDPMYFLQERKVWDIMYGREKIKTYDNPGSAKKQLKKLNADSWRKTADSLATQGKKKVKEEDPMYFLQERKVWDIMYGRPMASWTDRNEKIKTYDNPASAKRQLKKLNADSWRKTADSLATQGKKRVKESTNFRGVSDEKLKDWLKHNDNDEPGKSPVYGNQIKQARAELKRRKLKLDEDTLKIIDDMGHGAYRVVDSKGKQHSVKHSDIVFIKKSASGRNKVGSVVKMKEELDEVSKSTQYRRDNPKTKYRLTMRNGSTKVVTADSADSAKDQGGYNVAKVEKVLGEAGYLSFSRPGALKDTFGTKATNDYKAMKTMLVVDPKDPHARKGGGVKKINAKDWPKYEKMGFVMAEDFQEEVTFDDLNELAQTMRD